MKNTNFLWRTATLLGALSLLGYPALAEEWHNAEGGNEQRSNRSVDFIDPAVLGKLRTVAGSLTAAGPVITSGNLFTNTGDSASNDIIQCTSLVSGTNQFAIRVGPISAPTTVHQLLGVDNVVVAVANTVATGNGRLRMIPATQLFGGRVLDLNAPIKNAVLHRHSVSQKLYIVLQVGSTEIRGYEIDSTGFTLRWTQVIPTNTSITKPAIIRDTAVFGFFSSGFPNNTVRLRTFETETGAASLVDTLTSPLADSSSLGVAVDAKRNFVYFHSNRRIRAYAFGSGVNPPALLWNRAFTSGDRRGSLAIADNGLVYTQTSGELLELDPLASGATVRSDGLGTSINGRGPVLSDSFLWLTSTNNRLIAKNLSDFSTARIIAPAGTVFGSYFGVAGLSDGHLIAVSDLGVEQLSHPTAVPLTLVDKGNAATPSIFAATGPAEVAELLGLGAVDIGVTGGVYAVQNGATPAGLTPLFRLRNPATNDRIHTISATERDTLVNSNGFQLEPSPGFVFSAAGPGRKPFQRFSNSGIGFHAASGDPDALTTPRFSGFTPDGSLGFVRTQAATPLRRTTFFGSDVLSTSEQEFNFLVTNGGVSRGIIGRLFASQNDSPDLVPLFRLRNPVNTDFLYTSSATEKSAAAAQGFTIDEGTAGYVHKLPGAGRVALLRARDNATGRHLYMTDPAEYLALGAGIIREGIIGFIQK